MGKGKKDAESKKGRGGLVDKKECWFHVVVMTKLTMLAKVMAVLRRGGKRGVKRRSQCEFGNELTSRFACAVQGEFQVT